MTQQNHLKAKEIIKEFTKLHGKDALDKLQKANQKTIDFTADLFDRQYDFIEDPFKRKVIIAGRRSGKSHCIAYYLVKECYEHANAICAFIGITSRSAKDIVWKYIEDINERYKLGATPSLTQITWTFPNGSQILITGADNPKEIRKHLGKHYHIAVIDECGEFGPHLETLVRKVLAPTMKDHDGTICMVGTPGDVCGGFWYKISTRKNKFWSVHDEWWLIHNPKLPRWRGHADWREQAEVEMMRTKEEEGYDDDSPQYIRQYLGRWCEGATTMVYSNFKYDDNTYLTLPEDQEWNYLIGIDFGVADSSAIIVGAYSHTGNKLYITECFKQEQLDPEEMANKIKEFYDIYTPVAMVADGNGIGAAYLKQLQNMYRLPVKLAAKKDKVAFIGLLNDDFRMRKIKINESADEVLQEIYKYQWKDIELKLLPDSAEDHCLDALLYLWRESIHWLGKAKRRTPRLGDDDYDDYLVQQEIEKSEEDYNQPFWERIEEEI